MPLMKAPMKQGPGLATAGAQQSGGRQPIGWGGRDRLSRAGFGSYDTSQLWPHGSNTLAGDIFELCFLTFPEMEGKD